MFLGWLVLIVGQTGVDTLEVELDSQVSLLRQHRRAFQHCKEDRRSFESLLTIQSSDVVLFDRYKTTEQTIQIVDNLQVKCFFFLFVSLSQ